MKYIRLVLFKPYRVEPVLISSIKSHHVWRAHYTELILKDGTVLHSLDTDGVIDTFLANNPSDVWTNYSEFIKNRR